ncbi:hypothetical protein EIP91_004948 [Steccherinum ochraceum]|uniref:Uncharacterized protein n=1 Tax=Steccherinum ochraceum TaxID=92696 RepID=A0A4V2MVX0_9APHY|nr:hypothetical protein EIP91_004948 [Steccherinum ochraceum]
MDQRPGDLPLVRWQAGDPEGSKPQFGHPPTTIFARAFDDRGYPIIKSIDWDAVVGYEPHQATSWILYLHGLKDARIHSLLHSLEWAMEGRGLVFPQWPALRSSGLIHACMGILLQPGMFSDRDPWSTSFTSNIYGLKIYYLLGLCIQISMAERQYLYDPSCVSELYDIREPFFQFVWDKRHLLDHVYRQNEKFKYYLLFAKSASLAVVWLRRILLTVNPNLPPLPLCMAHTLLHVWPFMASRPSSLLVIRTLYHILRWEIQDFDAFFDSYFQQVDPKNDRDPDHMIIIGMLGVKLQDKHIFGDAAFEIAFVTDAIVASQIARVAQYPRAIGLIPGYISWLHRQMCSSTSEQFTTSDYLALFLSTMRTLVKAAPDMVSKQIKMFAFQLDVVSLLGFALVLTVKDKVGLELDTVVDLLKILEEPLVQSLRQYRHPRNDYQYFTDILCTSEPIWHDVLAELRAIHPDDDAQEELQATGIKAWRGLGMATDALSATVSSSSGMIPPQTSFASAWDADGSPVTTSIDWQKVVDLETSHVASWILYLHRRRDPQIKVLLPYASDGMRVDMGCVPAQWPAYRESRLMLVCMEILTEQDMFKDRGGTPWTFTCTAYGLQIFALLSFCIRHVYYSKGSDRQNLPLMRDVFLRRESFFQFLWDKRHLTESKFVGFEDETSIGFRLISQTSLVWLQRIFLQSFNHLTPLSDRAAHTLLYHWVYSPNGDMYKNSCIGTLLGFMLGDEENVHEFVDAYFRDADDAHIQRLVAHLCSHVQADNDDTPDEEPFAAYYVLTNVIIHKADVVASMKLPNECELFPSLLIGYHRQMCHPTGEMIKIADRLAPFLSALQALYKVIPASMNEQVDAYAGPIDFISVLGTTLVRAIKTKHDAWFELAIHLLGRVQVPLKRSLEEHGDARKAPGNTTPQVHLDEMGEDTPDTTAMFSRDHDELSLPTPPLTEFAQQDDCNMDGTPVTASIEWQKDVVYGLDLLAILFECLRALMVMDRGVVEVSLISELPEIMSQVEQPENGGIFLLLPIIQALMNGAPEYINKQILHAGDLDFVSFLGAQLKMALSGKLSDAKNLVY